MNPFCEGRSIFSRKVHFEDVRLLGVDVVAVGIEHEFDVGDFLEESVAHCLILSVELDSDFERESG